MHTAHGSSRNPWNVDAFPPDNTASHPTCVRVYSLQQTIFTQKGLRNIYRAMHCSIIPIVKPTRCTSVSNLFILERRTTCFGRSFHPSSGVQDCTYSNRHLSNRYCCLLANGYLLANRYLLTSRQQHIFDSCIHNLQLLMMDGKTIRNM